MATASELKRDFKRIADQNLLSHGYLFFGEGNAESLNFAKEFVSYLECQHWKSGETLVDSLILSGGGIDDVRQAINFLWQKPFRAQRKTLIIPNAGELTAEAQNAILKIAEEPPSQALLLLLVDNLDELLPTVVSRFQKIYCNDEAVSSSNNQAARDFLKASAMQRKDIIKTIVDDKQKIEELVGGLISELRSDIMKNWKAIREILHRWSLIKRFNVNKRLQLEAALLKV